jgi:hypothetical protein
MAPAPAPTSPQIVPPTRAAFCLRVSPAQPLRKKINVMYAANFVFFIAGPPYPKIVFNNYK